VEFHSFRFQNFRADLMQVVCPRCDRVLSGDDMNVVTDLARCPNCAEVYKLSSLVEVTESGSVDLNDPPKGAWYREEFNGFEVGATTRHPIALFLVPFMCVWSGGSLGGIYGTQFARGKFDPFMSLFGIPFLLGTLLFGSFALMTVCGKVVIRVLDNEGEVFVGIGAIGRRRRFDWNQITTITQETALSSHIQNNMPSNTIVLGGPHKLRFGSGLSEVRRDFIANVLRIHLMGGKTSSGFEDI
jgi:hypothetical protein